LNNESGSRTEHAAGDLTERELVECRRALLGARRDAGEQILGFAHDIRSPLTALFGELDWMDGRALSAAERAEAVGAIRASAERIAAMTADMLTFLRMEHDEVSARQDWVSLAALIAEVTACYRRRCDAKGIAIIRATDGSRAVYAYPTLLRRVIENLMDNAVRHTRHGGRIMVDARVRGQIEIVVSNDGTPINAADRERVFGKFQRTNHESSGSGRLGFGLYFSRRTIEAHGGTLELVDIEGWPTSFRIVLPR
jgi:signal transduction histidine kinase